MATQRRASPKSVATHPCRCRNGMGGVYLALCSPPSSTGVQCNAMYERSGLGRWRWVVERTFAWLNQFRRLRVRYEKRSDIQRFLRAKWDGELKLTLSALD